MLEIFSECMGICGSVAFALCPLPQVVKCFRQRDASQVSSGFIALSIFGNFATGEYVAYGDIVNGIYHVPLYFNYGVASLLLILLTFCKIKFSR